jgi:Tfp pilus assembly protein PilV
MKTYRNNQAANSGFSLMEITLAMFVLVFGILGIMAIFPVGLDSSRKSIENTTAALIGKSVLEYLRVDGTLAKVAAPTPWPDFEQPALFANSNDETGVLTGMSSASVLTCKLADGTTNPSWPVIGGAARWTDHILMITTGALKGKVYQISTNTTSGSLTLTQAVLDNNYTNNPDLDLIEQGTHFVILGKVSNTIPQNFFGVTPNLRKIQFERLELNPSNSNADYAVPADNSSESDYAYVCVLSGHLLGSPNTAQATILVYRNYEDFHTTTTLRPEQNRPPITYFTTILTR